MSYQPKFRTEKTRRLFNIHQQVEKGKLTKATALKKAEQLGYTSGGASSWFSWWRARAKEMIDGPEKTLKAKSQARMAAKLKATAKKMREATQPVLAVKPETGKLKKRA